jgi:hypothetical protein
MMKTAFLGRLPGRMLEIMEAQDPGRFRVSAEDAAAAIEALLSPESDSLHGVNREV